MSDYNKQELKEDLETYLIVILVFNFIPWFCTLSASIYHIARITINAISEAT